MSIRKALEIHLVAIQPTIETNFENVNYTPTSGIPYQSVSILNNSPLEPYVTNIDKAIGQGIFQITLKYPINSGMAEVESRGDLVIQSFYKGLKLNNNGTQVRIIKIPYYVSLGVKEDRFILVITVEFQSYNF